MDSSLGINSVLARISASFLSTMKRFVYNSILSLLFLAVATAGCDSNSLSPKQLAEFKEQTLAARLAVDVRIFDAISKGNTNVACRLLASQIDLNIVELYLANKESPLDKSSRSLYHFALD
jgi:hypothetical protein